MQKKLILIFIILILAIVGVSIIFLVKKDNIALGKNTNKNQESKSVESLTVKPQIPQGKVVVESATLTKNGFLVAREIEGNQLSQVIEMSKPLKPGVHKNIEISLGRADIGKNELIVMIYDDYANDGIFNDLDMPSLNSEGAMTASYVKTGKPLPSSIMEPDSSSMMNMPGMKSMKKIIYTDNGFSPSSVDIQVGDMVEFINKSSMEMWVASAPHPQHSKLSTFDQFRAYKKGGIYRYVFEKKGKWEFHDHLNPSTGGYVIVN